MNIRHNENWKNEWKLKSDGLDEQLNWIERLNKKIKQIVNNRYIHYGLYKQQE